MRMRLRWKRWQLRNFGYCHRNPTGISTVTGISTGISTASLVGDGVDLPQDEAVSGSPLNGHFALVSPAASRSAAFS